MSRFEPTLDSLRAHEVPEWFRDAKLGIFVHWYPAAVPAYAPIGPSPFDLAATDGWPHAFAHTPYVEWYQNSLALEGSPVAAHHAQAWPGLGYEVFVDRFRSATEAWDPGVWSDLFASSGARYVVFGTKHHDGVTLWPSRSPNPRFGARWSTARDCVGELATAVRGKGLRYGLYYSGGLDWTFGGLPIDSLPALFSAIPQSPQYAAYADAHWRELIERYGPDVLWNDIGYPALGDSPRLMADYYEVHPDGVVNDRFDLLGVMGGTAHADFRTPEYSSLPSVSNDMWEACRGLGHSFGYNAWEADDDHLGEADLVGLLVDVVSKGGNLLINVGPTATGDVPAAQARRLTSLGWWLRVNGEAVFATRPWVRAEGTTASGEAVRYTSREASVYAVVLDPVVVTPGAAADTVVELDVRPAPGATVRRLGCLVDLDWVPTDRGCRIQLVEPVPAGPGYALRISAATPHR